MERARSALSLSAKYLTGNRETLVGSVIVVGFYLVSLLSATLGKAVVPFDPLEQNVARPFSSPGLENWFGTDELGRDVFSRIVTAMPNAALVSLFVVVIAFAIGGLLGAISGYKGGWIDEALMRITDIFFAIPSLILAMVIAVVLTPSLANMMYSLAIVWWPTYARLSRAEALKVAKYHYVESARISGIPTRLILLRHVFPNIFATLLVYSTLDIGTVILAYSGLSYLGLSVQPPAPDWGIMVSGYQEYMISAPWLPLFPGIAITIVVIGFSLLGDGLRSLQRRRGQ
ncbi:MAG: ABC transporter permease [Thaumarchaeota archaeon]|nr:ABC transporter permease [Nitrososphaerota archaeon]MBI3022105.1 ABC transporter permease [Nitrososphaerota archaeon]MCS4540284.1 ABC transporter permease [Nitrososphaerota archaeon]